MPSNSSKSRIHPKFKEVRFETSPAIHLHRDGISDTTEYRQGTSRLHPITTSGQQTISKDSSFSTNFPFSFGQTQCSSRLCFTRQISFTTATSVSLICLETSYSPTGSSSSNKQYDLISFEMLDGHQLLHSGNVHPSSRSQCIPLQGCQPLRMGSLSRTDETILSWWLDGRPIPAPYQYSGSKGLFFFFFFFFFFFYSNKAIIYIHHSCVMISTDNTTVILYIYKQGGTHSPSLCMKVWEILYWCLEHDIVLRIHHISGKFNILADRLSRLDRPLNTEWLLDHSVANSIFQMLKFPIVDLFAIRFNHKLQLYVSPVPDNQALAVEALSVD